MRISVVTPWWNHRELLRTFADVMSWASEPVEFLIVDNGSEHPIENAAIRNEQNRGFSRACNQGLEDSRADAVLFLNNDVLLAQTTDWLAPIRAALEPGVLVGAELRGDPHTAVDGRIFPYLDGWCIAGMRDDLLNLGGWDDSYEEPSYYGDNDLCLRAVAAGFDLAQVAVPLKHISNVSSRVMDVSGVTARNRERYAQRVRELLPQLAASR